MAALFRTVWSSNPDGRDLCRRESAGDLAATTPRKRRMISPEASSRMGPLRGVGQAPLRAASPRAAAARAGTWPERYWQVTARILRSSRAPGARLVPGTALGGRNLPGVAAAPADRHGAGTRSSRLLEVRTWSAG